MQRLRSVSLSLPRCEVCCDLDVLRLDNAARGWEFNTSLAEYKTFSQRCLGCKIVTAILRFYIPNLDRHQSVSLTAKQSNRDPLRLVLSHDSSSFMLFEKEHRLEISSFPGHDCPWSAIIAADPISGDTGSDKAVTCVRSWLDQCIGHHGKCSRITSTARPARLIQIHGPTDVKLRVSDVEEDLAPYICLSHCWGLTSCMKTTLSTIDQYRSRINWDELPRTFQDAIFFAYRLGYIYIWIDSLCIIQDDIDDWRWEGSKMASIYQNAILTLFATHSLDSSGGCYAISRAEHKSLGWTIDGLSPEEGPYRIHTRKSLDHRQLLVGGLPLLKRGWALQERILSPRNLYFTEDELIWECTETWMCECTHIDNDISSSSMKKSELHPSFMQHEPLETVDFKWQRIVEFYSYMSLTYDKDIFPGLQGLAKSFPSRMGMYLAGLWRETLAFNLSWYSAHEDGRRPDIWRAPSWSWASVMGAISWFGNDRLDTAERGERTTFISIVDASTTPKGHDATGEIVSGELVIRGRALKGRLTQLETSPVNCSPTHYNLLIRAVSGEVIYISKEGPGSRFFLDYEPNACRPGSVIYMNARSEILVVKLEGGAYRAGPEILHHTAWLVLLRRDSNQDTFERIGLLIAYDTISRFETLGSSTSLRKVWEKAWEKAPEIEIRMV